MKRTQGVILTTVLLTAAIARAQPPPVDPVVPTGDAGTSVPDTIDRTMIMAALGPVQARVTACNTSGFAGQLKASVKIAPDGAVTSVDVDGPQSELSRCISGVLAEARFPPTRRGGSFSYPFTFGASGGGEIASEDVTTYAGTGDGVHPSDPYAQPGTPTAVKHRRPEPSIDMPEVLTTPTGWLLPAAVLYSKNSLDTGGGVTSDTRVGLGDVAEFGLATTDSVRERADDTVKDSTRIQPYLTASFRLGVSEHRLFDGQPGVTLGFRKSFERNHDGFKTRIAELTLVASKHLGKRTAIHLGGAFWDASLDGALDGAGMGRREVTMHGDDTHMSNLSRQIRVFGGLEVHPLEKSQILIDLGWAPEFCYLCAADADKIQLKPTLSWGVRYEVANWIHLESGVRVPDIGSANLLNAQIFGQVTFTSWALRRAVDSLKD